MKIIEIDYTMRATIMAPTTKDAIDKWLSLRLNRDYKGGNTRVKLEYLDTEHIEDENGEEIKI